MRTHWQHKAIWHKNRYTQNGIPMAKITAVQGGKVLTEEQANFLHRAIREIEGMEETKKFAQQVLEKGYYTEANRSLLDLLRALYIKEKKLNKK